MPWTPSRRLTPAAFKLAALLVAGCGRVAHDASAPDGGGGGAGQAAAPDGTGGSSFGIGGGLIGGGSTAMDPPEASAPLAFPYPFDSARCPGTPPREDAFVHCVTRAELARPGTYPKLVDKGIESLGPESSWRCPELNEIDFSRHCECCNEDALCGPVVELVPFDAGSPVDAAIGEQLCCYYTVTICLV